MKKHASGSALALAPLRKHSVVFLAIFTVALPGIAIIAVLAFPEQRPSSVAAVVAAAIVAAVAGVLFAFVRRRSIVLADDALVIRATLYTRRIGLGEISFADARALDLREHPEHRPLLKTNGLAVPGFAAGNFRDRKRNKLFCLVTAPRVVLLPLSDGSSVMVSPLHPKRFLDEIGELVEDADKRIPA